MPSTLLDAQKITRHHGDRTVLRKLTRLLASDPKAG